MALLRSILGLRGIHAKGWSKFMSLLLKTGQTTQYSSKLDDGYYKKGLSRDYTNLTAGQYSGTTGITLNSKTHNLSNNCVLDNRTGLMWARYVPNANIGPDNDGKLYWIDDTNNEDIFDFVAQANVQQLGGHNDWRVPNVFELFTLMVFEGASPFMDAVAFPSATAGDYWVSTTCPGNPAQAQLINNAGTYPYVWVETKATDKNYCRLVRG